MLKLPKRLLPSKKEGPGDRLHKRYEELLRDDIQLLEVTSGYIFKHAEHIPEIIAISPEVVVVGKGDKASYGHASYPDEPGQDSMCIWVIIPFWESMERFDEEFTDKGYY